MIDRAECIDSIKKTCKEYGDILGKVILFGSVARGTHNEKSDIDLYIESKNTKITTAKLEQNTRFNKFHSTLYRLYPDTEYDILTYGGKRDIISVRKTILWEQIQKDGIIIYDERTDDV